LLGYWLDKGESIHDSILVRGKEGSLSASDHTDPYWGLRSLIVNGNRNPFPRDTTAGAWIWLLASIQRRS